MTMKYPTLRHHQRCGNLKAQTTKPRRQHSLRDINSQLLVLSTNFLREIERYHPHLLPTQSSPKTSLSSCAGKEGHVYQITPQTYPQIWLQRSGQNKTVWSPSLVLLHPFPPIARLTPTLSELILTPPNPRWNTNHPPKIAASPAVCKLKTRVSSKSKTMLSNSNWSPSVSNKARSPMLQVAA